MNKLGKNYWLLWSGYTVSTLGTYLSLIVLNLFIYQMTRSPFLVGVFLLLRLIPAFFMGNIAGVLADKFNRKWLIIIADVLRAVLIFSVIFLRNDIYPLYFIIFGIAISDRLYQSAMGGSIPNIAGNENMLVANSYLSAGRTVALIGGPLLGGLIASFGAINIAFIVDAATYLFSALMVFHISADFHNVAGVRRSSIKLWQGLKEGYGYILSRAGILGVILIRCMDAFGSSALNVGAPIFASGLNQLTSGICYGLIYASFGAGEMMGALYLARTKFIQSRLTETIVGYSILFMGLFFGVALSGTSIYFSMIFLFLSGLSEGVTAVTYNVFLQNNPDEVRGRIIGTSDTSVWTVMGIGMFLSGLLAEKMPISQVVQIFSAMIVAGSVVYIAAAKRRLSPKSNIQPELA